MSALRPPAVGATFVTSCAKLEYALDDSGICRREAAAKVGSIPRIPTTPAPTPPSCGTLRSSLEQGENDSFRRKPTFQVVSTRQDQARRLTTCQLPVFGEPHEFAELRQVKLALQHPHGRLPSESKKPIVRSAAYAGAERKAWMLSIIAFETFRPRSGIGQIA